MPFMMIAAMAVHSQAAKREVEIADGTLFSGCGARSGVSVSSTRISTAGAFVYQPGFDSTKWSGSLKKLALTLDDNGDVRIATTAIWDAGDLLKGTDASAPGPTADGRKIYTSKINSDASLETIEFSWDKLNEAQQALLDASPADDKKDGLGSARLRFLRGERSLELGRKGGKFRARDRVLGDIMNSAPVYVGAPRLNVQGAGYQAFHNKNRARTKAVYVGANDGMLHAFNADDGTELFAYVPNVLVGVLNQLTRPEYMHRPYVDGAITVAEALAGGKWKTVLASGMGGGAQGVFALDVTDPSAFGNGAGAIWEFTDGDDPDMGNVMGTPVIAKFRMSATDGKAKYQYFVLVSSGLNNYRDDGEKADGSSKFNQDGAGALFLLSLDKKPSEAWTPGLNYYKFRTPGKDPALQNGLSSPGLAVDARGAVRFAYAGDLQGNLWRFDFTGKAPWTDALAGGETPLFSAEDKKETRQPVTSQPEVVFGPGGGYVVLFGTGQFIEAADSASGNFRIQSYYGIHDTTVGAYKVSGRNELAARRSEQADGDALKITGDEFSYGNTAQHKKGWYFDFPESDRTGERVVAGSLVADGTLYFNSLIPGNDPCATGSGRSYRLNALTGLSPEGNPTGFLSRIGMLSSPVRLETGVEAGDRHATGKKTIRRKLAVINFGSKGAHGMPAPAESRTSEATVPVGRFSWREIMNWQELRNAAGANKSKDQHGR